MYKNLKETIENVAIVDDHAHLGIDQAVKELGYPEESTVSLPDVYLSPAQSSFGFSYLAKLHAEAFTKYYGLKQEDLEDPNKKVELHVAYKSKRADLVADLNTFMKAGNVEHIITNLYIPKALQDHPQVSFIPTVDPLLYPFGEHNIEGRPSAGTYSRMFYRNLQDLKTEYGLDQNAGCADYLNFVDKVLDDYKTKGYSGYKIISAYIRSLSFPKPSQDGEVLFNKAKNGDMEAYYQVQDIITWRIMEKAAENGMPIQFHTATIDAYVDYTDPLSLRDFLQNDKTYNTKIVLLHSGWPLCDHAKVMAMAAKPLSQNNVYIDLSGRMMFGNHPAAVAGILRNFLEFPALWGKIVYGSDTLFGERFVYTCARTARDAVYMALSGMIDDGIVDESYACLIAKNVLRNNAIRLYNLPLEIK